MKPATNDPVTFRAVLAAPGERLVLALADACHAGEVSELSRVVDRLRREGVPVRLIVHGDVAPDPSPDCGFLERRARPILSAVLGAVEAVIPLSRDSDAILSELIDSVTPAPILLVDAERLLEFFSPRPKSISRGILLRNSWGIGDELLLSAVAREVVRAHPATRVWIHSRHGFRFPPYVQRTVPGDDVRTVETIYQNTVLYGPSSHSPFPGHLVQQMLDKVALDTGLAVKALDLRPELEFRPTPKSGKPSVIVHSRPNPRLPSKDWGIERWSKLSGLLTAAGVQVKQVGAPSEPLLPGVEDLRGTPVHLLPEIVAASWVVVSLVGFLMHLAQAVRTPAVVIYGGREHPAIDGYPDQVHLCSEPLACRGRWGCNLEPDLDCPHNMKCMIHITPELVAREVLLALSQGGLQ